MDAGKEPGADHADQPDIFELEEGKAAESKSNADDSLASEATTAQIVDLLCAEYDLLSVFFADLDYFTDLCRKRNDASTGDAVAVEEEEKKRSSTKEVFASGQIVCSRHSYLQHLASRQAFVRFVTLGSSLELDQNQVDHLWAAMVTHALTQQAIDASMHWFTTVCGQTQYGSSVLSQQMIEYIFLEKLIGGCGISSGSGNSLAQLTPSQFTAFEKYFVYTNRGRGGLRGQKSAAGPDAADKYLEFDIVDFEKLVGVEALWTIVLEATNEDVTKRSIAFLNKVHERLAPELTDRVALVRAKYIEECMRHLKESLDAQDRLRSIRCLTLLNNLLDSTETKGVGSLRAHGNRLRGYSVMLQISNEIRDGAGSSMYQDEEGATAPKTFELRVFSNDTVWELRKVIAQRLGVPAQVLNMVTGGKTLTFDQNSKRLIDFHLTDGQKVLVNKRNTAQNRLRLMHPNGYIIPELRRALTDMFVRYLPKTRARRPFNRREPAPAPDAEAYEELKTSPGFTKADMAVYILACGAPDDSASDSRLTGIFRECCEPGQTEFLTADGFCRFYQEACRSREECVWSDLRRHGFRDDLRKEEDVLEELLSQQQHETELPRYILSANDKYFNLLFHSLNQALPADVATEVWQLIQRLPTNPVLEADLHALDTSAPGFDWDRLLDSKSLYKLLYSLQILESLSDTQRDDPEKKPAAPAQPAAAAAVEAVAGPEEQKTVEAEEPAPAKPVAPANLSFEERMQWRRKFLGAGGFVHLYAIFMQKDDSLLGGSPTDSDAGFRKECHRLLLNMVGNFLWDAMGPEKPELFQKIERVCADALDEKKAKESKSAANSPKNGAATVAISDDDDADMLMMDAQGPYSSLGARRNRSGSVVYTLEEVDDDDSMPGLIPDDAEEAKQAEDVEEETPPPPPPAFVRQMSQALASELLSQIDFVQLQERLLQTVNTCAVSLQANRVDNQIVQHALNLWMALLLFRPAELVPAWYELLQANARTYLLNGLLCRESGRIRVQAKNAVAQVVQHFEPAAAPEVKAPAEAVLGFLLPRLPCWKANAIQPGGVYAREFFDLLAEVVRLRAEVQESPLESQLLAVLCTNLRNHRSNEVDDSPKPDSVLAGSLLVINEVLRRFPAWRTQVGQNLDALAVELPAAAAAASADSLLLGEIAQDAPNQLQRETKGLVDLLFNVFLFGLPKAAELSRSRRPDRLSLEPAGAEAEEDYFEDTSDFPKCKTQDTRSLAYQLLLTLGEDNCGPNFQLLVGCMLRQHAQDVSRLRGWDYSVQRQNRHPGGYVGLKNQGSTCYMNSLIQQFYMMPKFRAGVLLARSATANTPKEREDDLLYQFQTMFGYLTATEKQAYDTKPFCHTYKDPETGQPINVRIQQDAQEFFNVICDRLQHSMKGTPQHMLIPKLFGGKMISQVICHGGCNSVRERPEDYLTSSLQVQGLKEMSTSLEHFVSGEVIGNFNCATCDRKVDITKRTVFGTLSDTVIFHLKRFELNYETWQHVKLNDEFRFPLTLDMEPYTREGRMRLEAEAKRAAEAAAVPVVADAAAAAAADGQLEVEVVAAGAQDEAEAEAMVEEAKEVADDSSAAQPEPTEVPAKYSAHPDAYYQYELRGVLVHTGSAQGGHYYSYIRERRPAEFIAEVLSGQAPEPKWFEFNDHQIYPFDPKDMEAKCFGGVNAAGAERSSFGYDTGRPAERINNAYMLVYERVSKVPAHEIPEAYRLKAEDPEKQNQLDEELQLGDGVPDEALETHPEKLIPEAVLAEIHDSNLKFRKERQVYTPEHFEFIHQAVKLALANHPEPAAALGPMPAAGQPKHLEFAEQLASVAVTGGNPEGISPELGFNLICMASQFAFNTLIHCANNQVYPELLKTLGAVYAAHPTACAWVLREIAMLSTNKHPTQLLILEQRRLQKTGETNTVLLDEDSLVMPAFPATLLREVLLDCRDNPQREATANLLVQALGAVFTFEQPALRAFVASGQVPAEAGDEANSVCLQFLGALLAQLEDAKKNWFRFEQYWSVFLGFAKLGPVARGVLVRLGLIEIMGDLYLGDSSPIKDPNRAAVEIGNRLMEPKFEPMFELMESLVRSCAGFGESLMLDAAAEAAAATEPDEAGAPEVPPPAAAEVAGEAPEALEEQQQQEAEEEEELALSPPNQLPLEADLPRLAMPPAARKILGSGLLYSRAMEGPHAVPRVAEIAAFWAWRNNGVSCSVVDVCLAGVKRSGPQAVKPFLVLLQKILELQDNLQHARVRRALNKDTGILQNVWAFRNHHPLFSFNVVSTVVELLKTSPALAEVMAELRGLQWPPVPRVPLPEEPPKQVEGEAPQPEREPIVAEPEAEPEAAAEEQEAKAMVEDDAPGQAVAAATELQELEPGQEEPPVLSEAEMLARPQEVLPVREQDSWIWLDKWLSEFVSGRFDTVAATEERQRVRMQIWETYVEQVRRLGGTITIPKEPVVPAAAKIVPNLDDGPVAEDRQLVPVGQVVDDSAIIHLGRRQRPRGGSADHGREKRMRPDSDSDVMSLDHMDFEGDFVGPMPASPPVPEPEGEAAGAQAGNGGGGAPSEWACAACTYLNSDLFQHCEICGSERPM